MPTSTVNWLWFGNQPLLDSSPTTDISNAQKNALIGYQATGSTDLKAVAVTGDYNWGSVTPNTNGFATHWAGYTGVPIRIPTDFSYTVNGTSVSDVHAISAFSATVRIQTGANPDVFETQTATVIQMENGDLFLRPQANYVDDWDLFVRVYSIEVTAVSTSFAAFNHTIGFKPSIFDVTFPCFVKGTKITTPRGDVPVEALKVGDLVSTR